MSQENVNILRKGYQDFGQGNIPAVLQVFDDNIEWIEPDGAMDAPGSHRGPQGVVSEVFGPLPENYEDFAVTPKEFIDGGEKVVVLGEFRARGKGKTETFTIPFSQVWEFKNGKVVWTQAYYDTATWNAKMGK